MFCFKLIRLSRISHKYYSTTVGQNYFDVIISGGGMVGTAMACALAKNRKLSDKKTLLLEEGNDKKYVLKPEYSNRVVSITPSTRQFFNNIGAWNHISDVRYSTVKKLQIWETESDALLTFNHDDFTKDVSYIVENDVVLSALDKVLKECKQQVTCSYNTKVANFEVEPGLVSVTTSAGQTYTCKLLIGADGANSKTRQTIGVKYLSWNYHQRGIVATLRLSEPTDNVVAWQRFLPTGPIALLPLNDDTSSLVWTTTEKEAKRLLGVSNEQFVDELNDALWRKCTNHEVVRAASQTLNKALDTFMLSTNSVRQLQPSVSSVVDGSRASFPLGFGHSVNYVKHRVALIGDAAHKVHPLAGLGVNLGFGDIQCLTDILASAVYNGSDIGLMSQLQEYESKQQRHNFPTMIAIDGLQKIYNINLLPVVLARTLGVQLVHSLNPLKKAIMRHVSTS